MARYWNADMEQLDRKSIGELQNRKLRAALRSFRHHAFYSHMFREQGIDPADIQEVRDLQKLPFTAQQDMAKDPEAFVLSPSQKATEGGPSLTSRMQYFINGTVGGRARRQATEYRPVMMLETMGTYERPYYVYLSTYDLEVFKELCGRGAMCAGLTRHDRYQNTHHYGQRLDFWHAHYTTLVAMKAFSSSTGHAGPLAEATLAERLGTTAVAGNPIQMYYFARAAARSKIDLGKLGKVLLSSYAVDDRARASMMDYFSEAGSSPDIIDLYAVTEARMSFPECPDGSGFHTFPDIHVWECIDPKTGEDAGPGAEGELVFTTIDGRGTTLLRYRTGDIAEGGIVYEPCESCGRTGSRIIGPIRKASELKGLPDIRNVSRDLMDVDGILYATVSRLYNNGKRLLVRVTPDGTVKEESLRESILKACGGDESVAVIKLEDYLI